MGNKEVEYIVNRPYLTAAIIRGIREKVWLNHNTKQHIASIWLKYGLMCIMKGGVCKLTEKGKQLLPISRLLEYHLASAVKLSGINVSSIEDGSFCVRALGDYSREFMSSSITGTICSALNEGMPEQFIFADLGAGSGVQSDTILRNFPGSSVVIIDKDISNSKWLQRVYGMDRVITIQSPIESISFSLQRYDFVIACEFLHFFNDSDIAHIVVQAHNSIVDNGYFLVIDRLQNLYLDWRLNEFSSQNPSIFGQAKIIDTVSANGDFKAIQVTESEMHHYSLFKRIDKCVT